MSEQVLPSRRLLKLRTQTASQRRRGHTGFENFLREILTTFVRCPAANVDREIERWMSRMVAELQVDRSSLFQVDNVAGTLLNSHQAARRGIPKAPQVDAFKTFPWTAAKVLGGRVVRFDSPDDIPRRAALDRENYQRVGLRSNVIVPLMVGGHALGGLSFASLVGVPDWTPAKVRRLKLVASVFANALMRKRAVLERRNLLEEHSRLSRASTVGELAASLAHELNQPIGALIANAEAAKRFLAASKPAVKCALDAVGDIETSVNRAEEVVARVRNLFKSVETQRSTVRISQILADVSDLLQLDLVSCGVELRIDVADDLPPLLVDKVQICQVMTNLLSNALDAMANNREQPRRVEIAASQKEPGWLTLTVSDTGTGVEATAAARIFDTFFTTKPTGMGMGLAICRSILEVHGGSIRLAASSSPGATFEIRVPLHGYEE
jgi:signal transduction histidine kinase